MMELHERLWQFRLSSGMTQTEVAEKLYVTRQTVSSYESGRTQPDVETLTRLAEVYGVSLQGLVDAALPVKAENRGAHRALWWFVSVLLLCALVRCTLLLVANLCYVVPEGRVDPAMMLVLETRNKLLDVTLWLDLIRPAAGWWLGLLLLVQRLMGLLPVRKHWMAVGILGGGLLLMALLGSAVDPLYAFLNHWGMAGSMLARAVLSLLVGMAIERLAKKKTK